MTATTYPVHVEATLDTKLSRWLWLVKWVLLIPHYVVLAFLWLTFAVLSAVALVAIVATGHYPRSIFEFNVGVLRWSWRVAYYAAGAFGTDRYPPFTLAEVPDYPAHLTVDYPERLSRGLVLVKWWLLAIPHYLIVGLLTSGGLYLAWDTASRGDGAEWSWGGGLIGLLALVAGVVLLFTGRYPQQLFDLLLGLNRWVLRVAAYAGLMTDEYPPFRLDMGGADPDGMARVAMPTPPAAPGQAVAPPGAAGQAAVGQAPVGDVPVGQPPAGSTPVGQAPVGQAPVGQPPAGQPPAGQAPTAGGQVSWGPGRIVAVVMGALAFFAAGGFLLGGTTLAVADATLRTDDGFLMSPTRVLSTEGYAIASEPLDIDAGSTGDLVPEALLGEVAVRADAAAGDELFVGVAPSADVEAYLAGVGHDTLTGFEGGDALDPQFRASLGGAPEVPPAETDIWAASTTGTGEQELTWEAEGGDWTVVLMNADAGAGVSADVSVGATVPALTGIAVGLLVAGGLLLVVAIALVLGALHGAGGRHQRAAGSVVPPAGPPPSA